MSQFNICVTDVILRYSAFTYTAGTTVRVTLRGSYNVRVTFCVRFALTLAFARYNVTVT